MKRIILFLGFCMAVQANAQIKNPVKWLFSSKKINKTTYEIHITGTIEAGWHTYSQFTPEGGPVPSSVTFSNNPLVTVVGKLKEIGKLEQHYEQLFGVDVKQYSNKIEFVQTITLKKPVKTSVAGVIEYMVCNDSECLPPNSVPFTIGVK